MAEYLERDALLAAYDATHKGAAGGARKLMVDAPAADVAPVRHGRWIENFSYGVWHYDCSNCDDGFGMTARCTKTPNYCQNCGARMDLEVSE